MVVIPRFAQRKMTGKLMIFQAFSFTMINSMLMWNTWMRRFSGNANFFFFQTVVSNVMLDVVVIQIFDNVNKKTNKYVEEVKKVAEAYEKQSKKDL